MEANLIWGTCFDESLEAGVSVTVIATGFNDSAIQAISGNTRPSKQVVDLKQQPQSQRPVGRPAPQAPQQQAPGQYHFDDVHPRVDRYNQAVQYRQGVMQDMRAQHQQQQTPQPQPYRPSYSQHPPQGGQQHGGYGEAIPPSDANELAGLEREPAYLRYRRERHGQQPPPQQQPSRTVVDQNGEPRLGGENPWLYDKAD